MRPGHYMRKTSLTNKQMSRVERGVKLRKDIVYGEGRE